MRNKITDLNNYLFEQLERINDDELDEKGLKMAIAKSKAVVNVAKSIVDTARVQIEIINTGMKAGYNIKNEEIKKLIHED